MSGVGGLSCSPFLFLSWKLVALLLGDKETLLSLAAALGGALASIVPVFTSGANVSPREGLLDPPSPTISTCFPQPFVSGSRYRSSASGPLGPPPPPSHLLFNLTNVRE